MSAHVVVIDATARRATIKTTPAKHLADVLQEACSKLGYSASQYGLKYGIASICSLTSNKADSILLQAQPQATRPFSFLPSLRSELRSETRARAAISIPFCRYGRATTARVRGPRGSQRAYTGQVPQHDNYVASIAEV